MRLFNAAPLELKKYFKEDFTTNHYEAGWASECIFFIMVEDIKGTGSSLVADVEISHDGMAWVKEGTQSGTIDKAGLHFIRVTHFGNWLRLNCRITGESPEFKLLIQIALKE